MRFQYRTPRAVDVTAAWLALNQHDDVQLVDGLPFFLKDQNMPTVLNRRVLVLNRAWQVIDEKTVQQACIDLAGGNYTALDIDGDKMVPVKWDDWINLPPLHEEEVIHTKDRKIRMPTVIIACNFERVRRRRPKFNLANIARRDGYKCQYTGKVLSRNEMSLDHVIPLSRGGEDSPDNVVLAHREVNNRKGNRLPSEAGLPEPHIRRLGAYQPDPTHPHHKLFLTE